MKSYTIVAALSAPVLFLLMALVTAPSPAQACTISCSGSSILDCTPCCGSSSCICSDTRQCVEGTFGGVWANTRLCYRTGIKFENSTASDSEVRLYFSGAFCDPICISPGVFYTVDIEVPAFDTVSKYVDQYFGINRHAGAVVYEVLSGGAVSALRSDTFDCVNHTIDKADSCTEE